MDGMEVGTIDVVDDRAVDIVSRRVLSSEGGSLSEGIDVSTPESRKVSIRRAPF